MKELKPNGDKAKVAPIKRSPDSRFTGQNCTLLEVPLFEIYKGDDFYFTWSGLKASKTFKSSKINF